ncbi:MAG: hypothetical protein LBV80_10420 [Deltaproteobacteria bacterium]|jgi:wyosine [tRNA(Phe)-imidazoG37] synthetase (radical SAM superfamily)|nr:hypothetical protein [Deltaproteobacteria bacterium]
MFTDTERIVETLLAGLTSRDGDAGFAAFKARLACNVPKIWSMLHEAHCTNNYEKIPEAIDTFLTTVLDVNIVDVDFLACRTSAFFANSFAPVLILCSLARLLADNGQASDFLHKLSNLQSNNHCNFLALSRLLMEEGRWREAANAALQARALKEYDLATARAVNATQRALYDNGLPPDFPPNLHDNTKRFCAYPFTDMRITSRPKDKGKVSIFNCICGVWQPLAFSADLSWNSEDMQEMRRSILDGDYRYCDEYRCHYLREGSLPLQHEITDPYLQKIIESKLLKLPSGPSAVQCAYDYDCNLSCPSCRASIYKADDHTVAVLDSNISELLPPLLPSVKLLSISQAGEALASRHSMQLLKSLTPEKYPDLKVKLFTNMSLVSSAKWQELEGGDRCIKILSMSIDGVTKETLEKLRRGLKWPRLLDALNFVRSLRKSGTLERLEIIFMLQKDNYQELPKLLEFASEYCVDEIMVAPLASHGSYTPEEFSEVNIYTPNNPLFEECKVLVGKCKKLHAKMKLRKKEIEASGRSVPEIMWRVW